MILIWSVWRARPEKRSKKIERLLKKNHQVKQCLPRNNSTKILQEPTVMCFFNNHVTS